LFVFVKVFFGGQMLSFKEFGESLALGVMMLIGLTGLFSAISDSLEKEKGSYSVQLEALERVEESLGELSDFVGEQKEKLFDSQKIIEDLKEEHSKLRPVVEAERKTVDAVLALQEESSKRDMWLERVYGFFLGVISSLAATGMLTVSRYLKKDVKV
jgi:hypothetical protein